MEDQTRSPQDEVQTLEEEQKNKDNQKNNKKNKESIQHIRLLVYNIGCMISQIIMQPICGSTSNPPCYVTGFLA